MTTKKTRPALGELTPAWRGREIELADLLAEVDPHDTEEKGDGS